MRGQVIGRAGGGLTGNDAWAHASLGAQRAGRDAEVKVGGILSQVAERGPTVLHDLRIPIPGFSANIDHVIVHGKRVIVVDTKAWAAGRYWTLAGKTRRGYTRAPHCDKQTIPTAVEALGRYLKQRGIVAVFDRPVLAISQAKPTSFLLYRPQGRPKVILSSRLPRWSRRKVKSKPADPDIIHALAQLVN